MSLSSETQAQLKILLDKPISVNTTQQILTLISKRTLSNQVLAKIFIDKYRGDLLIFLIQSTPLSLQSLQGILQSVRKDILKYSRTEAETIWSLALRRHQFVGMRQEWGFSSVLREGIKITNEETKQRLLWLASSNFQIMKQLKEGKIIKSFVEKYFQQYLKYNIYMTPFAFIALQCLQIAVQSSAQLLDPTRTSVLLQRTLFFLESTAKRLAYSFHNQCLLLLAELLKVKDLQIDSLQVYSCKKVIEQFLYKKATRQGARLCKQILLNRQEQYIRKEEDKMSYNYNLNQKGKQIGGPPLLVQKIIERVNDYRFRQQLTCFQPKAHKRVQGDRSKSRNKEIFRCSKGVKLEELVQSCLQKTTEMCSNEFPQQANSSIKPQFYHDTYSRMSEYSQLAEESPQFVEISSLIDLAFQYKFG